MGIKVWNSNNNNFITLRILLHFLCPTIGSRIEKGLKNNDIGQTRENVISVLKIKH